MRGHIRKRGQSWAVVVYLGRDHAGRERHKWFTFPTRRDAERHLAGILSQLHGGGSIPTTRCRFYEFAERWLNEHVAALEPKTRFTYEYDMRHYVLPELSQIPLARLSAPDIQRVLTGLHGRGLKPSTVHQVYRVIRAALNRAVAWDLLPKNPCVAVQPPRVPDPDLPVWDDEQTRVFLGEAKRSSPYYLFYMVMIFTSARPCEVLALTWQDVDLLVRVVHIQRKFIRIGRQQITGATKTKDAETVTIPDPLAEELREHRRRQDAQRRPLGPAYENHGLVFCQPNGRPLHAHNISQRDFRRVVERAGLPRIRLYDLRALSATTQLDLGVPLHVVQRRTRHKQATTLLRHYARVLASKEREAADLLSERLLGAK